MPKVILVTGPTTVGKTQLVYEIARRKKGEVINGDKFFFYREFNIGTGITDSLNNTDIEKHLYQILDPFDNVPDPSKYTGLANDAISLIGRNNHLPIMEVYPFSYVKRISEESPETAIFGLRPQREDDFEKRLMARLEIAIEQGLITETEQLLQKGLRNTFVMENSFAYRPLIRFLDGLISLEEAKKEILQLCLEREKDAHAKFQTISSMKWISHNSSDIEPSIRRILQWV
jgi:tRNA A37 N6-isopentenylltransferase MiaA